MDQKTSSVSTDSQVSAVNNSAIVPEEQQQPNPLDTVIYAGKNFSSLFEDIINGVDLAQQKTLEMIRELYQLLDENNRGDMTQAEITLLIAPILKDYIAEFGRQAESKVKVATAAANIVAKTQPNFSLNQMYVQENTAPKAPSVVERLKEKMKEIDPLANSFKREVTIQGKADDVQKRNDFGSSAEEEDELSVIHSPDWKPDAPQGG